MSDGDQGQPTAAIGGNSTTDDLAGRPLDPIDFRLRNPPLLLPLLLRSAVGLTRCSCDDAVVVIPTASAFHRGEKGGSRKSTKAWVERLVSTDRA
jgi:hypothetical protein